MPDVSIFLNALIARLMPYHPCLLFHKKCLCYENKLETGNRFYCKKIAYLSLPVSGPYIQILLFIDINADLAEMYAREL